MLFLNKGSLFLTFNAYSFFSGFGVLRKTSIDCPVKSDTKKISLPVQILGESFAWKKEWSYTHCIIVVTNGLAG